MIEFFKDKNGIEIGGPSPFFNNGGRLLVYDLLKTIDNVNFSSTTVWTGKINDNLDFIINGKVVGKQYIAEGSDLSSIDKKYDFLLSSNNLEHIANPMKAIEQWVSVLNKDGVLVIVVPKKESNFDHNREIVDFNHLLDDYNNNVDEHDLTHLDEILKLHDLKLDPPAGNLEQFRERSLVNFENRCLHHHVFDLNVLTKIFNHFNITPVNSITYHSDYLIIGKKNN